MKEEKLKNFLKKGEDESLPLNTDQDQDDAQKTITAKDGLIERVDVKLVTKDGKQLLKEQLHERN